MTNAIGKLTEKRKNPLKLSV